MAVFSVEILASACDAPQAAINGILSKRISWRVVLCVVNSKRARYCLAAISNAILATWLRPQRRTFREDIVTSRVSDGDDVETRYHAPTGK